MKRTRVLSALVAAAMLSSYAGVAAFAQTSEKAIPYNTYNYVALGDSIAAGFGLAGGDLAQDPALVITDRLLENPVQGAYPAIFTGYLKELGEKNGVEVNGTNLASTAYRARDIEKTIRKKGYKGEFAASILETYAGEGTSDVLLPYHDIYNKYLKDADLVSIQLGGNDIVMSIIPEMTESENPVLRATGISMMLTLFGTDRKTALGGGMQVLEQNKDAVTAESFLEAAAYMKNIGARSEELVNESANNVRSVVNAVQDVNDDADIALVGMFNPYRTEEAKDEAAEDISEVLGKLYSEAADTAAETEDEVTTDGEQTKDYIKMIKDQAGKIKDMKAVIDKYNDPAEMEQLMELVGKYDDMNEVRELADLIISSGGSPAEQDLMKIMTKYKDIEELQAAIDIVKNNDDVSELKDLAAVMGKYRTAEETAAAEAMAEQIAGPIVMQIAGKNVDPQMKLLNEKLKAIAEEEGATYVDVYGISPETDSDPHPNANGHKEIAGILYDTMLDKVSQRMEAMDEVTSSDEDVTTESETTPVEDKHVSEPVSGNAKSEPENEPAAEDPKSVKEPAGEEPEDMGVPAADKDKKPEEDKKKSDTDKTEKKIQPGDVNGDGQTNVGDIAAVAAHIKGIRPLDGDEMKRADVNGDGVVNVTDIAKIAAHIKGIDPLS